MEARAWTDLGFLAARQQRRQLRHAPRQGREEEGCSAKGQEVVIEEAGPDEDSNSPSSSGSKIMLSPPRSDQTMTDLDGYDPLSQREMPLKHHVWSWPTASTRKAHTPPPLLS